jgi:hypothetical protein
LFSPSAQDGHEFYTFAFNVGDERPSRLLTDRTCIETGRASYTILDYGRLGVTADVPEADSSPSPTPTSAPLPPAAPSAPPAAPAS